MKPGAGLIGRKLGMTLVFRPDGRSVAVTVLAAGPCTVVQMKNLKTDGYQAVQLGFEDLDPKKVPKPLVGHFEKCKVTPKRVLREFRLPPGEELAVGSTVSVELFKPGDRVDVTGTSIGKGFQGGVKRWHWKGGPQTHGSMSHRAPGSIGSSTTPGRVWRGHHLPGRMGGERVTTEGLEVIQVNPANHLLLVEGSVPGYEGGLILIRRSRKPPKIFHAPPQKKAAAPKAQAAKPAAPKAAHGAPGAAKTGAAKK